MTNSKTKIPEQRHECLQPIYDYVKSIKDIEPDRAKRIAKICLELRLVLDNAET